MIERGTLNCLLGKRIAPFLKKGWLEERILRQFSGIFVEFQESRRVPMGQNVVA